MILSVSNISKSFGTDEVLKDIAFHINDREKAAIVGINGAGKSTLFKIIVGESTPDSGEVVFAKGSTFGYLSQHQDLVSDNTIYEELLTTKADVIRLEETIRSLELQMKHLEGEELEKVMSDYTRATHEFEMKNGYAYKSEVVGVLKGLGFEEEEFDKHVNKLSGGQKTRIALGKLLLNKPDLIMLDEPTNHLDMQSISWLEDFLALYKGAVIVIAHDRYFLDRIVTKVIEIEHHKARVFEGNYTAYAEKKAALRAEEIKHYYEQQKDIKHQEEVIAKLKSFNREKSIKRAESREKMLAKVERLEKPVEENASMNIKLEPNILSGNDVLAVKHLAKAFGENRLFNDISFEIKRGERVAIIGANGTGKTTILKMINGLLPADSGEIVPGAKVYIGYYDQEHQVLSMEKTLFEEISDDYPAMDNTRIRNALAAFLFTGDDVFKQVKELSGGERGRVSLCKLMLSDSNFLILDEPTNHLDMISKEILENALLSYTGTVLYVSHDRYFINKTATRILDLTSGHMLSYPGNYENYLEKREANERLYLKGEGYGVKEQELLTAAGTHTSSKGLAGEIYGRKAEESSEKVSYKQEWQAMKEEQARKRKRENDLKKIEAEIEKTEKKIAELDELISDEKVYTDVEKLMEVTKQREAENNKLIKLMEEWEALAE
ncbi:MAG: ABC-F family ATP-binding cassette domain-containing protein [Lachnospiraceae bacterium]|nr:ABC-F family ATP-binding cassette domain-containing protein [Lachnospiraceae bacterium]